MVERKKSIPTLVSIMLAHQPASPGPSLHIPIAVSEKTEKRKLEVHFNFKTLPGFCKTVLGYGPGGLVVSLNFRPNVSVV